MSKGAADPNKKYVSHALAEWACGLRFEHLSPAAVERAKLFWYDSMGCALGGSQQEDSHILVAHHKDMNRGGTGPCTLFVDGFKTNPVDAAFVNNHMVRAMDYNDI